MNFEIIQCEQGAPEWDALRAVRPTASEFGKIFTGSGKPSEQRELYMRSLAIATKYQLPKWGGNAATQRGHDLEPVARERLIAETGFDVREAGFCLKRGRIRGCSPDGLIYHNGVPVGGIEIKCYNLEKHLTIANKGVLPTENKPQVHGLLEVTGLAFWLFVTYNPEAFPLDFRIIEVTPDSYTSALEINLDQFENEYRDKLPKYIADYETDAAQRDLSLICPVAHRIMTA
jgi:hypothetical protein